MPPLSVRLTINNPDDPTHATVEGAVDGAPVNPAIDRKDLYKAIYPVSLGDYRHFGTLRAAVAWAPALITFGLTAAFLRAGLVVSESFLFWSSVGAVFVLIYLANHHLQIEQRKRWLVARKVERSMVRPDERQMTYPELINENVEGVIAPPSKFKPDGLSWLLLGFFRSPWIDSLFCTRRP